MSKIHLPTSNLRPPKTTFLTRFEDEIARLNDFYWGVRAGFHTLTARADQGASRTDEFLPADIARRWLIEAKDVPRRVLSETERMRHLFLVQAVTLYEDYVASILRDELTRVLIPTTPGPLTSAIANDLREEYVESVVRRVVNGKYAERAGKLHKALGIDPEATEPQLTVDRRRLNVAGEARNCIVHTGGVIDQRAANALSDSLTGITLGAPLSLTEEDLFKLVEALRQHVEAVDLLVRLRR